MAEKNYVAIARKYARDVVAGRIPAAKPTRLACARTLRDHKRKDIYFDRAAANHFCAAFELFPHIKGEWANRGEKLTLEPWGCWIFTELFGWKRRKGGPRRFRTAYIEIPRKNGKSTKAAALGNYMVACDGEAGAEVYAVAKVKKQTDSVFKAAQEMARRDPEFREAFGVKVGAHSIYVLSTASTFESVPGEAEALEGKNPHCGIIDELHVHRNRQLLDVFSQARGARSQPLLFIITTAGDNKYGICYEKHQDAMAILEGLAEDDSFFCVIYTIDEGDDWTSELAHRKANPNYGVSVDPEDMRTLCAEAQRSSPSAQASFKTKRLNVWVDEASGLFDVACWKKCGDRKLLIEHFDGEECAVAVDLASREDIASVAYEFKKVIDGREHFYGFVDHYLPEARIEDSLNLSYKAWHQAGYLIATPGATTDFFQIQADIAANSKYFQFKWIAVDPWQSTQLIQGLQREGASELIVEFRQSLSTLSEPTKDLMALHREGRFHHDGDPVLQWMAGNVVGRFDAAENVRPKKTKLENKIDGMVALAMTHGCWLRNAGPQEEEIIYGADRGLRKV